MPRTQLATGVKEATSSNCQTISPWARAGAAPARTRAPTPTATARRRRRESVGICFVLFLERGAFPIPIRVGRAPFFQDRDREREVFLAAAGGGFAAGLLGVRL